MGGLADIGRSNLGAVISDLYGKTAGVAEAGMKVEQQGVENAYKKSILDIHQAEEARKASDFERKNRRIDIDKYREVLGENTFAVLKKGYDAMGLIDYVDTPIGKKGYARAEDLANAKTILATNAELRKEASGARLADWTMQEQSLNDEIAKLKNKAGAGGQGVVMDESLKQQLEQLTAKRDDLSRQISGFVQASLKSDIGFQEKKALAEEKPMDVEKVVGPDGKPVIVPRKMSIGQEPYVKDSKSAMEDAVSAVVELGEKGNLSPAETTRLKSAKLFIQLSQQTGMSQPVPVYDGKGNLTGLAGIVNKGGQMTTTYMPVAVPSGSTAGPKPSAPPETLVQTANQLGQIIADTKRAVQLYDPSYVGIIAGPAGQVMDKTGIGANDKRQVFNSSLLGIRSIMVYLRTGKQINETEINRLDKELPTGGESETAYLAKMKRAVSQLKTITDSYYKQQVGSGHTNLPELEAMKTNMDELAGMYGATGGGKKPLSSFEGK